MTRRSTHCSPDGYHGGFFSDLAKKTVRQLARTQAAELRRYRIAAVSLTLGVLRSEAVLDDLGVTEEAWWGRRPLDPPLRTASGWRA